MKRYGLKNIKFKNDYFASTIILIVVSIMIATFLILFFRFSTNL